MYIKYILSQTTNNIKRKCDVMSGSILQNRVSNSCKSPLI
jgi:hypothetical protein